MSPLEMMFIALIGGYICGSIPFGLIFTKAAGRGDIRKTGSGNIGATNVLRAGGKKLAALTLLCDALKGALPVLLILHFAECEYFANWDLPLAAVTEAALMSGLGAILGHMFPVWLGFKGGKAVATTIGVLWGLSWILGLAVCLVWLAVAFLFRFSSLAGLVAIGLTPVYMFFWSGNPGHVGAWFSIALLVFMRHRENIRRLRSGEEPKIGQKK